MRLRDDPIHIVFQRYMALTAEQRATFATLLAGYNYRDAPVTKTAATRKPGRPKGSPNKAKEPAAEGAQA